jgi:hypothetical protein
MEQKTGYIVPHQRKKILLLTDDIRVTSGVAQIGREMVINTSHRYNWVQLAGAVQHPEKGKRLDISGETNTQAGIDDSSVILLLIQDILHGFSKWKMKLEKISQLST